MNDKQFIERLCSDVQGTPDNVEVFAVRPFSIEENARRAKRLIAATAEMCHASSDRADWVQQADRTLARLPGGGRAVVYHASGALRLATGLATMESLFEKVEPKE